MRRPFSGYWVGGQFYASTRYFIEVSPAGSMPSRVQLADLSAEQAQLICQGNYIIFVANYAEDGEVTLVVPAEQVTLAFGEPQSGYGY